MAASKLASVPRRAPKRPSEARRVLDLKTLSLMALRTSSTYSQRVLVPLPLQLSFVAASGSGRRMVIVGKMVLFGYN